MTEPGYRERLRGEVLDLAVEVLHAEGLDGLQARRIAKQAGCSVGSLYNVFGDIDGFIAAVNMRTLVAMRQALEAALARFEAEQAGSVGSADTAGPAATSAAADRIAGGHGGRGAPERGAMHGRLLALALAYARFAIDHPKAWEAIFKHRRPAGQPAPDDYIAEQGRLLALIERSLGAISDDARTRGRMARALFGAVHGIVSLAVDNRLAGALRPELEAQVEFVVAVLVHGLGGRHGGDAT